MEEHVALRRERNLPLPEPAADARVTIQNAQPHPDAAQ